MFSQLRRPVVDAFVGLATLAIILSAATSAAQAATAVGHTPVVNGIKMITPTTGWATTAHAVLHTSDGGMVWTRSLWVHGNSVNGTASLSTLGTQWAWVVASTPQQRAVAVYRTKNGGMSWTKLALVNPSPRMELLNVGAMSFVDATHGWLLLHGGCGAGSCEQEILQTTNGGSSWARVEWNYIGQASSSPLPACDGATSNMEFVSQNEGWVTGLCGAATQAMSVYVSGDEGRTWHQKTFSPPTSAPLTFFNPGLPSAFTPSGCSVLPVNLSPPTSFQLYSTCNRGASWTPTKHILAHSQQFGPNAVYDVLSYYYTWARVQGKLYRTSSSGVTWQVMSSHPNLGKSPQIDFVNPNVGFVAQTMGASNILTTADGGRTWSSLST